MTKSLHKSGLPGNATALPKGEGHQTKLPIPGSKKSQHVVEENLILAEWKRNTREIIRVTLSRYHGGMMIGIRVWYSEDGKIKPGRQGITLPVRHLQALGAAIDAAIERLSAEAVNDVKEAGR